MKKQPELTERTKNILIDTFWQLYRENDIRKITIKDITEKAGYNRSTFYQYFIDIYDVLNQLEDSLIDYISITINSSFEQANGNDFIEQFAQLYELKGEYISVLLGENGDPLFVEKLKTNLKCIVPAKLEIKKDMPNSDLMFEFAISAILSTITKWYNLGKPIPSEELVIMLRTLLFNGTSYYMT